HGDIVGRGRAAQPRVPLQPEPPERGGVTSQGAVGDCLFPTAVSNGMPNIGATPARQRTVSLCRDGNAADRRRGAASASLAWSWWLRAGRSHEPIRLSLQLSLQWQ